MVRCLVFFFALLLVTEGGFAQLPELYRSVDRVTWVVKDLKPVIAGWEKMDAAVEDYGILEHKAVFRGRPVEVRVRAAGARIGNLLVDWVQPLGGENAYTEFLAKHGDGVFALVHRAPGVDAVEEEVARMRSRGVAVLQRGAIDTEDGSIAYVQFDTEPQGKYSLGLISVPPFLDEELPETAGLSQVTQFAFVARDIHAVSAYWQKLGFPAMDFTHPALTNRAYRGQPGRFDQELGWQRQGKVVYEWIQPLAGPTVYEDGLKAHGEGINHIAFDTGDMEKTIAQWGAAGYGIAQSGNWGETGKAGSGRFAYVDTNPVGGVLIELLWNYRP